MEVDIVDASLGYIVILDLLLLNLFLVFVIATALHCADIIVSITTAVIINIRASILIVVAILKSIVI